MAKLIVEIEIDGPKGELEGDMKEYRGDWFPDPERPDHVSVDHLYLKRDPEDDSFYIFKLLRLED